jgi:hypothetical protein
MQEIFPSKELPKLPPMPSLYIVAQKDGFPL